MNNKEKNNRLRLIAEIWYLIAPVVVYLLSQLENIINKTCNWWLFGFSMLILVGAQVAAKFIMENVDGGEW